MNNNKCTKCGYENDNNCNFCANCGEKINLKLENNIADIKSFESEEDKKRGNILGTISLLLPILGPMIFGIRIYSIGNDSIYNFLELIGSYCPLVALIILIIGRIKYPKNHMLKNVMWLYIYFILSGAIMTIIIYTICATTCKGMPG